MVEALVARFTVDMLSTVNAQGGFGSMIVEGHVNASVFRDFSSV